MNLQLYRQMKKEVEKEANGTRSFCRSCWQPSFNCFCHKIESFDPKMEFVILIHPIESRRRVATGRMSYLSLKNSHIIRGCTFEDSNIIKDLIEDKNYYNVILARGHKSVDITSMTNEEKTTQFSSQKKLRIFVIDSTWSKAKKMVNQSPDLLELPQICFIPPHPSNIRVRKQPDPSCYCTLEAIHHTIELLGDSQDFDVSSREHDNLLKPFNWIVERQLARFKR